MAEQQSLPGEFAGAPERIQHFPIPILWMEVEQEVLQVRLLDYPLIRPIMSGHMLQTVRELHMEIKSTLQLVRV